MESQPGCEAKPPGYHRELHRAQITCTARLKYHLEDSRDALFSFRLFALCCSGQEETCPSSVLCKFTTEAHKTLCGKAKAWLYYQAQA